MQQISAPTLTRDSGFESTDDAHAIIAVWGDGGVLVAGDRHRDFLQ
jgi:hypothetical protein